MAKFQRLEVSRARRAACAGCALLLLAAAPAPGQRVANTTLALPSAPPSSETAAYSTTNAFPGLTFTNPVAFATPPGETNRLFVVEQNGRIIAVTNLASPSYTVFLDIRSRTIFTGGNDERGLLGLAFHPGYASNRYFYVFYVAAGTGNSNRVSRFSTLAGNPNAADTNSEVVLIGQYDDCSNHNGGDVHFGPDGYLYVSLGDEGSSNDGCNGGNSQRIDKDFFSGLLRLDVDQRPGSLPPNPHSSIVAPTNYAVPPDNPFVGATQFNGVAVNPSAVRTEFWAVGLRNPYRFSFDEVTGDLYVGDVGQGAREEVDLVQRGGNYGWKWREGFIATPGIGTPPAGFTNALPPILDYPRTGSSTSIGYVVTGGRVYRGDRFPELVGRYVFCDYGSGNIWSLTNNGPNPTTKRHLATDPSIAAFGVDPRNGDLLLAHRNDDQVKRLERTLLITNFPASLAQAGAFTNLETLAPAPGLLPYEINTPFWSDHAVKARWFSVPSTNLVIGFDPDLPWSFPTSTVWVKHFDLLLTSGVPASARRIETRFLVKNEGGGYGVTYRWGDSRTNAYLVPDAGLAEPIAIDDGGTIRTQVWVYPSRNQCLACHNTGAGFPLGFGTAQLNRDAAGGATNQLLALSELGYFHTNLAGVHRLRRLAPATDEAWSLEYRVRSYLQANCAACHYPGGPASGSWDARILNPLSQCGLVDGTLADHRGDPANRVIAPGDLAHSMLHTRIAQRGGSQMPPLGSTVVDTQGVALVAAWVQDLASRPTYAQWRETHFGSVTNPLAADDADADGDGGSTALEYLTGTDPTNAAMPDAWSPRIDVTNDVPVLGFERVAHRGFEVQVATNLREDAWRFLDVAANAPFFSATNLPDSISDTTHTNGAFYRVRVYEP